VSGGVLRNCVVYFNRAAECANYDDDASTDPIWIQHSCTTPLPAGSGNIDADPQLLTATHLSPASPCIGAGDPDYASGVDLDGEPWADPPAMGADQPGLPTGLLSVSIDAGLTNVAAGYPVLFRALNTGPILKSVWDFGDGTLLTNQPFPSHAWSTAGVYAVQLTGYNDSHPSGVTATVMVTVSMAVYYVDCASANPVFPYRTWKTAARTIQDAIGAGTLAGRMVLVADGVYRTGTADASESNRVALTNVVVVQSMNGPEATMIEGETNDTNSARCAYVGDGSILSGFTLTNGTAGAAGGVLCELLGMVTNCTITGNSAYDGGGVNGGTLYRCTLTGNSGLDGGGALRTTLYDCVLTNNSAGWGGGAGWSTLYNCTLAGNSAEGYDGGGATFSTLYNCTLSGNSAGDGGGGASHSTLYNSLLNTNSTGAQGGGASSSQLYNCALIGNSAGGGGGSSSGTLYNCKLTGNFADSGGGSLGDTLFNCTLVSNQATNSGGGAAAGTLNNCIVYYNEAPQGANYEDSSCVMNYCCTIPKPSGMGNLTNTPMFVDYMNGDLRLQPNSPCINAGRNDYAFGPTDLDGNPRIIGGTVDIGCYEFQGSSPPNPPLALHLLAQTKDDILRQGFGFLLTGESNRLCVVEYSADLRHWIGLWTNHLADAATEIIDPDVTNAPARFYRALLLP